MAASRSYSVRVENYRETMRALNKVDKGIRDLFKDAFKEVGQPIAEDVAQRLVGFQGISLGTIGPKVTTKGMFITQRKRKVTGKRGDFGSLQMTRGFLPAAEDNQDRVDEELEKVFERLADSAGF